MHPQILLKRRPNPIYRPKDLRISSTLPVYPNLLNGDWGAGSILSGIN